MNLLSFDRFDVLGAKIARHLRRDSLCVDHRLPEAAIWDCSGVQLAGEGASLTAAILESQSVKNTEKGALASTV